LNVHILAIPASYNSGFLAEWYGRTEELLAGAGLLNDLNETRLELLDGGNVVGEDTHLTGLGGNVHLNAVLEY
jgi:hypothetical protein